MMICPKCGQQYESLTERCSIDGAKLVIERSGQLVDQRYRLEYPVGVGGMGGAVWAAIDLHTQTKVALKIVPSVKNTVAERFKRGAIIAKTLEHENITKVFGFGQTERGELFLVMELLNGHDLHVVSQTRSLTFARVLEIMDEVLAALDHAHGMGVLHRDIKLGNIFIATDEFGAEKVKILDFGIARYLGEFDSADPRALKPVTAVNQLCGTPQYMAPEQLQFRDVDHRIDIYATGVAMYRLLAGKFPYDGSVVDVFRAHVSAPIPKLSDISKHLFNHVAADVWLAKAMAKRPEDRFQSAQEMRQHLRQLRHDVKVTEPAIDADGISAGFEIELVPDDSLVFVPSGEPRASRRPIGWLGAAIAVVVAAGFYALLPVNQQPTGMIEDTVDQASSQNGLDDRANSNLQVPKIAAKQIVKLYSNPSGATVVLGTETLGRTPHRFSLPIGVHPLTVKKVGFKARTLRLEINRISDGVMTEAVTLLPKNGNKLKSPGRPFITKKQLKSASQETVRKSGSLQTRKSKKEFSDRIKKLAVEAVPAASKTNRPKGRFDEKRCLKCRVEYKNRQILEMRCVSPRPFGCGFSMRALAESLRWTKLHQNARSL